MDGLAGQIITAAAVLAALGVIGRTTISTWRGSKRVLADAVEHVMAPHVDDLRGRLDDLDSRQRRFEDKLDQVLAEVKPNGGHSLKDRVVQVHRVVVDGDPVAELDELGREGKIGRRHDDPPEIRVDP